MKIGLQTISFGPKLVDVDRLFPCLKSLGYDGLELSQKPHILSSILPELSVALKYNELTLLGLSGGGLKNRVSLAVPLGAQYLYSDEWDEEGFQSAIESGIPVAIHPHYYKSLDTVERTLPYLERLPELKLILDTGHSHLSSDDLYANFNRFQDRILAIHLKDWSNRYGMSPVRFSRGFTTLGDGVLGPKLQEFVRFLQQKEFGGWLIVEQDSAHGDALDCAAASRAWLRKLGV